MRLGALLLVIFAIAGILVPIPAPTSPSATAVAHWRNTKIPGFVCFDPIHPHVVYTAVATGTLAYDWDNGVASFISPHPVSACGPTGVLYSGNVYQPGPYWRFSPQDPIGERIPYFPTHFAQDGSPLVYSNDPDAEPHDAVFGRLYASADGGHTWQERGAEFGGNIHSVTLAAADARVVYAAVVDSPPVGQRASYTVYASTDAGATWARGTQGQGAVNDPYRTSTDVELFVPPGPTSPVDMVVLLVAIRHATGGPDDKTFSLSADGGRSFNPVFPDLGDFYALSPQLVHDREGLVRWVQATGPRAGPPFYTESYTQSLNLSTDQGRSWQPLTEPPLPDEPPMPYPPPTAPPAPLPTATLGPGGPPLMRQLQVAAAPANLFLSYADVFYSPDGGRSWQQLPDAHPWEAALLLTPYLPLSLLQPIGGPDPATTRMAVLDLPAAGRGQTAPVPASHAPGSRYFPATGHNIAERILRYWDANGGLAQFGLPRTEAFPEVSPTDGRIYWTQYFERARFEYHPELAGGGSEIELGLLGSESTSARRAAGEGGFNPIADAHYPGAVYFPATRHNLRNNFLAYWETHGGLALYGYPLSEEFYETSPEDGRAYVVQYFQRNRFEWPPEHRGTSDEVQLGLLGNALLHAKGWP